MTKHGRSGGKRDREADRWLLSSDSKRRTNPEHRCGWVGRDGFRCRRTIPSNAILCPEHGAPDEPAA